MSLIFFVYAVITWLPRQSFNLSLTMCLMLLGLNALKGPSTLYHLLVLQLFEQAVPHSANTPVF